MHSDFALQTQLLKHVILPRFNYRVANYARVYYACGHCNATGTGPGDKETGAYSFTNQLKDITASLEKHDPKQKVEEVRGADRNCLTYQ